MILIVNTTSDTAITDVIRQTLAAPGTAPETALGTAPGTAPETALGTAPGTAAGTVPAARAEFEIVEAADMKISHCIGCNFCWLKTPGICSIKDDYEEILKKMIHADQIWVISGTALGFLDHKGKNIFDRIMPLVTMYLKFKGDQMRHVMRYKKNADVIGACLDRLGIYYTGGVNSPYIWMKCPDGLGSWEFFDLLLDKCRVVGTPGEGFGACGKGYFRLTSFNTHEKTAEAADRIGKYFG